MAVHDRHLQVHQHQRPGQGIGGGGQAVQGLLAVVGDVDAEADRLQEFDGDLLVDRVVLDQQHPQAQTAEGLTAGRLLAFLAEGGAVRGRQAADNRVPEMGLGDRLGEESGHAQGLGLLAHVLDAEGGHHDDPR